VNPLQATSPNSIHILFSSSWSSAGISSVSPSSLERRGTKHFQIRLPDLRRQLHQLHPKSGHGFNSIGPPPPPPPPIFLIIFQPSPSNFAQCTGHLMATLATNAILASIFSNFSSHSGPVHHWALAHHHPLLLSRCSLKRRRCGLPFWPPHGTWKMAVGFVLPTFVMMPLEAAVWFIDPLQMGRSIDGYSGRGRGRSPQPSQGHPKDEVITALHRVVRCRRIGVGHARVLTWSGPEAASLHRRPDSVSRHHVPYEVARELASVAVETFNQWRDSSCVIFDLADREWGLQQNRKLTSFCQLTRACSSSVNMRHGSGIPISPRQFDGI
jgi:hypothetical protein